MDESKSGVLLSVDLKKFRIRIHKTTLNQLGFPSFIQLLINPIDKIIAVRGIDRRCKDAHVVSFTHIKPDNSYELYSKQLILTLMSLLPDLNGNCSYRLTGETHVDKSTAFFPLSTIQRIEEANRKKRNTVFKIKINQ
ncbi:MAG: hypothetical protein J1F64_08865 [Oscillospiraceae bacterium]|nr:hypothetical protein [Oscillospiraceae bacterium]